MNAARIDEQELLVDEFRSIPIKTLRYSWSLVVPRTARAVHHVDFFVVSQSGHRHAQHARFAVSSVHDVFFKNGSVVLL